MWIRIAGVALVVIGLALVGLYVWSTHIANPRVTRELQADPDGPRARKVMLLTLPSGRTLPVNYLREGGWVYAGADGAWWHELEGEDHAVSVFIRGESHPGVARAVTDDPEYTKRIFARLRPNALPGFGTLVEIRIQGADGAAAADSPVAP